MRCSTNGQYPRYILWENVPGAFSSNKGYDFKAVLEAIIQIAEPEAEMLAPDKNGWPYADILVGNGWSVAYRTIDAQYFGVAQRRKRIYLVADFGSERVGEVLFESEGMSRDFTACFSEGQRASGGFTVGTGEPVRALNEQGGVFMSVTKDQAATLRADMGDNQLAIIVENHPADSRVTLDTSGKVQTLTSRMGTGGGNVPLTLKIRSGCGGGGKGALVQADMSSTISCSNDQTVFVPKTYGICSKDSNAMKSANPRSGIYEAETSRTLDKSGGNPTCNQGGIAVVEPVVFTQNQRNEVRDLKGKADSVSVNPGIYQQAYILQGSMIGREEKNGPQGDGVNEDIAFTLNTCDKHAVAYAMTTGSFGEVHEEKAATLMARDYKDMQIVNRPQYIVRRLTPKECAKLQGFPDWWCDALETPEPTNEEIAWWDEVFESHRKVMGTSSKRKSRKQIVKWLQNPRSDSTEYKMWGNGVALPCVNFVLKGIVSMVQNELQ